MRNIGHIIDTHKPRTLNNSQSYLFKPVLKISPFHIMFRIDAHMAGLIDTQELNRGSTGDHGASSAWRQVLSSDPTFDGTWTRIVFSFFPFDSLNLGSR